MKILGVFLLLLGVFLFIGGLVGVIIAKTAPEPYICTIVEGEQKRAEEAVKKYKEAKGSYQEYGYRKTAELQNQTSEEYAKKCTEKKEKLKYWLTVSSIVSGFGFLLTITGIFNLPKRKMKVF